MKLHPEDTEEDYALFGKIVLLWGHVEASLITTIWHLIREPNKLPNRGIPQNFNARVSLALEGYATLTRYAAIKDEAADAITALVPLHQQRTVFVHGFYDGTQKLSGRYAFGVFGWSRSEKKGILSFSSYTRRDLEAFVEALASAKGNMEQVIEKTLVTPAENRE